MDSFEQTLAEIRRAMEGWQQIDPSLTLGTLSIEQIQRQIEEFETINDSITAAEVNLTRLRNDRHGKRKELNESRKRILSAIRGLYGDDSNEYEMVGGTRLSERRRPSRAASNGVVSTSNS